MAKDVETEDLLQTQSGRLAGMQDLNELTEITNWLADKINYVKENLQRFPGERLLNARKNIKHGNGDKHMQLKHS